jgi:hypothetical protein
LLAVRIGAAIALRTLDGLPALEDARWFFLLLEVGGGMLQLDLHSKLLDQGEHVGVGLADAPREIVEQGFAILVTRRLDAAAHGWATLEELDAFLARLHQPQGRVQASHAAANDKDGNVLHDKFLRRCPRL